MRALEREQTRRDIAEAFAFIRFLVSHPRDIRHVRNGAEIRILPAATKPSRTRLPKRVQAYSAETVFRTL